MRKIVTIFVMASMLLGYFIASAQAESHQSQQAQQNDRGRDEVRDQDETWRRNPKVRSSTPRWSQGERLPRRYRDPENAVQDWRSRNLPPPQRGYHWVCDGRRNCFLVRNTTGVIRHAMWDDDRTTSWRERYRRQYTYRDDLYYRDCREWPDPAGILIGGIIGGLLGDAIGRDEPGALFAGIIISGSIGAALTRDLDCDDRGYAYRAFHLAFNGGRPRFVYRWRNPHNRHHGQFWVRNYYYDPYGFRCARYSHRIYAPRARIWHGYACRQPDGAWVFLR